MKILINVPRKMHRTRGKILKKRIKVPEPVCLLEAREYLSLETENVAMNDVLGRFFHGLDLNLANSTKPE